MSLSDYVGQSALRDELRVFAEAQRRSGRWASPLCFRGPTGSGKTAIARALAAELGLPFHELSAPRLTKERFQFKIRALMETNRAHAIHLDDLHALDETPEFLFASFDSPGKLVFTAAATRALPDAQLRRRFIELPLQPYTESELAECGRLWARKLSVAADPDAIVNLVRGFGRGCPGRVVLLLKRASAHVVAGRSPAVDSSLVSELLRRAGVVSGTDLDERDLKVLAHLREAEGAVGKQTLAEMCEEDPETYECEREPYLLSQGYLSVIRGQGRRITSKGLQLLGDLSSSNR